jgi:hypothetical protein
MTFEVAKRNIAVSCEFNEMGTPLANSKVLSKGEKPNIQYYRKVISYN